MITATQILADLGLVGPGQARRIERLTAVLERHPGAWVEICSDEKTGCRYGQAQKRRGRCEKIGNTTYSYQVWAVWPTSEMDHGCRRLVPWAVAAEQDGADISAGII